jgi:hypothetical protein
LGLLLKVSFAVFVGPAFLLLLAGRLKNVRLALTVTVPCLLIAGPWYALNGRATLANVVAAGWGYSAAVQGTGPVFSFTAISTYLARIAQDGVSSYYCLLAAILLTVAIARRRVSSLADHFSNANRVLLAWCLPFLIFIFGGNKDIRYIAPVLPSAALGLALLIRFTEKEAKRATLIGAIVLAIPFAMMVTRSFGRPMKIN